MVGHLSANQDNFAVDIKPVNRIEYVFQTQDTNDFVLKDFIKDYEMGLYTPNELKSLIAERICKTGIVNCDELKTIKELTEKEDGNG